MCARSAGVELRTAGWPAALPSAGMRATIVVIDDEPSVQEVVRAYLERDGFSVRVAGGGREGLAVAERAQPSLVILDLMLPDVSGEEVCRQIRRRSDVPILMLTAKASEDERVDGLRNGADDYLTKPFSPRELTARVHAILRRAKTIDAPLVEQLSFDEGRLTINTLEREVLRDGKPLALTPSEYRILLTLARYPGRVYARYELLEALQGHAPSSDERSIDVHVKNLRKKLEPDPRQPRYVETVFGVGYRLARR